MVWKNPFQLKNSEEQVREREFLALFDCSVLQMIGEENFAKVSFVSKIQQVRQAPERLHYLEHLRLKY